MYAEPYFQPIAPPSYPVLRSALPEGEMRAGPYVLRFARTLADLHAVQRLRFEVFNVELAEGLESAFLTGRDEDEVDAACHHLMVEHRASGRVIGTYRLMLRPMADARGGFYSESEYDLRTLPDEVVEQGVELGRACVHADHRNGRVIHLLWRGLGRYVAWNHKRYLFGCCSLPTLDESAAVRVLDELEAAGQVHPRWHVDALRGLRVAKGTVASPTPSELPPLLQSYLALGAKVCGAPAVDRAFKVIDLFVVLDVEAMPPRVRESLTCERKWTPSC